MLHGLARPTIAARARPPWSVHRSPVSSGRREQRQRLIADVSRTRYDAAVAVIRYAQPGDEEQIIELGTSTYEAHFGELWTPEGLAAYLAGQFPLAQIRRELEECDAVRYVVAERDGDLIGFAKIVRDRPVTGLEGERGLWLQKLYLLPKVTRQGIGSILIDAVTGIAGALDEPRMWLDVMRSNTGAIRLYERHGFVRRIEIPWATDLRDIGMWVMTRLQ